MAAAAPSSILEPQQQQAGPGETLTQSKYSSSSSAWRSSGPICPFFAVIIVLAVLAVLSCYLGRRLNGREPTPSESITGRGCFGRVKRMCGEKVTACSIEKNECKVNDGEAAQQNPTQV